MGRGEGTGMPIERYLAIFGSNVWKNFQKIQGCLELSQLRSIVDNIEGGDVCFSLFGQGSSDFMYSDKYFEKIIRDYVKRYAEETGIPGQELIDRDSTWMPTALRAKVSDLEQATELADNLQEIYEVETEIYTAVSE